jgi:hypothetical protein
MRHKELTEKIIGCAYRVYNRMGYGFLESVYEKSLVSAYEIPRETRGGPCLESPLGGRKVEVKRKVKDLSQG